MSVSVYGMKIRNPNIEIRNKFKLSKFKLPKTTTNKHEKTQVKLCHRAHRGHRENQSVKCAVSAGGRNERIS